MTSHNIYHLWLAAGFDPEEKHVKSPKPTFLLHCCEQKFVTNNFVYQPRGLTHDHVPLKQLPSLPIEQYATEGPRWSEVVFLRLKNIQGSWNPSRNRSVWNGSYDWRRQKWCQYLWSGKANDWLWAVVSLFTWNERRYRNI